MCVLYIYIYTGCNKGGVTVSDAAALLPWSSPRSLDFHCFKSAVRHFCFAYHCRFSPSHSLPCLALSVLRAVITSHYTFSLVVFDQSHELHPTDMTPLYMISQKSYNLYKKKWTIKQNKHTNQQVIEKMGGGRRLVGAYLSALLPHVSALSVSGNEAEALVPAGCTLHSSAVRWDHWALHHI